MARFTANFRCCKMWRFVRALKCRMEEEIWWIAEIGRLDGGGLGERDWQGLVAIFGWREWTGKGEEWIWGLGKEMFDAFGNEELSKFDWLLFYI